MAELTDAAIDAALERGRLAHAQEPRAAGVGFRCEVKAGIATIGQRQPVAHQPGAQILAVRLAEGEGAPIAVAPCDIIPRQTLLHHSAGRDH
ncbi:hypothetical protein P7L74_08115 [Tistrella mobilis]|uniref:hypothetical protein n=1 Tax=Tistrella mobilis TaxID=171437 RepID=UPI003558DB22